MKKLIILFAFLISTAAVKAQNPENQYCGRTQYGYLYQTNLYSGPFGLFWKYPRPVDAVWVFSSSGFGGANTYFLICKEKPIENVPMDSSAYPLYIGLSAISVLLVRKLNVI